MSQVSLSHNVPNLIVVPAVCPDTRRTSSGHDKRVTTHHNIGINVPFLDFYIFIVPNNVLCALCNGDFVVILTWVRLKIS